MKVKKLVAILVIMGIALVIILMIIKSQSSSVPLAPITIDPQEIIEHSPAVSVSTPIPGQIIQSPVIIRGEVPGYWFFEASFPIKLYNENNELIGTTTAQPEISGDETWMTEKLVNFKAELTFNQATSTKGTLVLEKDNPSGLPENAGEFRVPVEFTVNEEPVLIKELTKVKIYFSNNNLDPEVTCTKVFPVEREVIKTPAIARAALNELLLGPSLIEKEAGFLTSINPNVKIQTLSIEKGIARVDFNEELEAGVGGSCHVAAIMAQISDTLKQFSSVERVIVSINGRSEDILQP